MTYADELRALLGTQVDGYIATQIDAVANPLKAQIVALDNTIASLKAAAVTPTPAPAPAPAPAPTPAPTPTAPTGWKLAWADEFNGTSLNTADWTADHFSTYGSGNGHTHINTDSPRNLLVKDGALQLIAQQENPPLQSGYPYSAAHVSSKGKREFTFGKTPMRFEARAKWALGPGFLPCPLWLRPAAGGDGEIDLVESTTKTLYQTVMTVHQSYTSGIKHKEIQHTLKTPFTEYHLYAVEIDPTGITYYVDDVKIGTLGPAQLDRYASLFGTDRKWFIHITQAVGGTWVGDPTSATKFPAPLTIDYIRAYTKA
jgi:beta-glucanase (GH16 family)